MADYDSINTEPGIMETSGVPRRILGAPTMEDNVRASINQDSRLAGSPTLSVARINQKLPAELKDLQITEYDTCPVADIGCILAKDTRRFQGLCTTKDYIYCSKLDEIVAGGAMENPFTFLMGGEESDTEKNKGVGCYPRFHDGNCIRCYYKFNDGKEGEKLVFDEWLVFLHPDNKYWATRKDAPLIKALKKAEQFCHEKQWEFLEEKIFDFKKYIQEAVRKSSPVLPNLNSGRISTFDIRASMDKEGHYISLEGKKGTPYALERLGLTHIVLTN